MGAYVFSQGVAQITLNHFDSEFHFSCFHTLLGDLPAADGSGFTDKVSKVQLSHRVPYDNWILQAQFAGAFLYLVAEGFLGESSGQC